MSLTPGGQGIRACCLAANSTLGFILLYCSLSFGGQDREEGRGACSKESCQKGWFMPGSTLRSSEGTASSGGRECAGSMVFRVPVHRGHEHSACVVKHISDVRDVLEVLEEL